METTYLVTNSSLSPHLSPLLLIFRLLSGLEQSLNAVLLEPDIKLEKTLLDIFVGLSLEFQVEAAREMTFG